MIFAIYILIVHYIADFLLQTRKMGENKGKDLDWLIVHITAYTLCFAVLMYHPMIVYGYATFFLYVMSNSILHFLTDFLTSKLGGFFYLKAEEYKKQDNEPKRAMYMGFFWKTIGLDQLIHGACLLGTYHLICEEKYHFIFQRFLQDSQTAQIVVAMVTMMFFAIYFRGILFFFFDFFKGKNKA